MCKRSIFVGRTSYISFSFNDTAPTEIYTLSLHDALPILSDRGGRIDDIDHMVLPIFPRRRSQDFDDRRGPRSEEHTSELQSRRDLVCRLLLEKKKNDVPAMAGRSVVLTCLGRREAVDHAA